MAHVLRRWNNPYSPKEKEKALKLLRLADIQFVAHRYHCTIQTVYRWKKQYDGTLQSLANGSHRPHSQHPNAQTEEEKKHIADLIRRNPNIGLNELYGKLRRRYAKPRTRRTRVVNRVPVLRGTFGIDTQTTFAA